MEDPLCANPCLSALFHSSSQVTREKYYPYFTDEEKEVLWGYVVLLLSLLTTAANSEHICTSVMTLSDRYVLTHSHSKIGCVIREVGTPFERPGEVEQFAEGHTTSWW